MDITDQEARDLRQLLNTPTMPPYGTDNLVQQRAGRTISGIPKQSHYYFKSNALNDD